MRPLHPERDSGERARGWVPHCGRVAHTPHVVILPEEGVILHRPLLQLHVQAAAVDGHNLADAAGPQGGA